MSPDPQTDVVLRATVVSFDGRVLELFGHRDTQRVHIAEITQIKSDEGQITIGTRNQMDYTIVLNDGDEASRAGLDSLIDEVRRSAPNLKEGA
jgi:hypothetical protein